MGRLKLNIDEKLVIEKYNENYSIRQIACVFRCSTTVIRRILEENNIQLRDHSTAAALPGSSRKKLELNSKFEDWESGNDK